MNPPNAYQDLTTTASLGRQERERPQSPDRLPLSAEGVRIRLALPAPPDPTEGRRYEVRKVPGSGWSYRILYPDGAVGIERGGFWSEQAARRAARDEQYGETEWHP